MGRTITGKKNKFNSRFGSGFLKVIIFAIILSLLPLYTAIVYGVSNEWDGSAAASFAGGTGTEADPYLISTAEQLAYLSQQVNKASGSTTYEGKYIKLTQDILLNKMNANGAFVSGSPRQFTSIGSAAKPFKGTFDGNGFAIIGLYNTKNWVECQGLFGYAGAGSVIRNVKISGSITGGEKTGAVAGYTNGLISGCEVNCPVMVDGRSYQGGIAGYAGAASVISNCTVVSKVKGSEGVGGIVGYTNGKVTECSSSGIINGVKKVGGIAGYAAGTAAEISSCNFTGAVNGNSEAIGGIAGQVEGLITGCTVNATIEGSSGTIGGVAGYAAGTASMISNCTITGTVKANGGYGYVGGAAGKTDGKITGCVSGCTVIASGQHLVGGIVGSAGTGSEVSNSTSTGNITATGQVGGIAGYTDGVIQICINTGNVTGGSGHAGGVAGEAGNHSTVSNSFNSGAVTGGGEGGIGGIVGYAGTDTVVHHNLNQGTVDGNHYVGSVIGNTIDPDNAWNNYYYDYSGAPGGSSGTDIMDGDGAVPVGEMTWEEIQDLLNQNNDVGDDIWNQDLDDDGVPKPGGGGSGSGSVFKIENAAVKEGKYYTAAQLGEGAAAVVTAESVFTAAFGLKYKVSCALEEQTLKLKNDNAAVQLPGGASIIMLAGDAYYYINLTVPVSAITLGDFIKMGSADLHYSPAPAVKHDVKEYLFIFDFSKTAAADLIPAGSYNIELSHPGGGYTGRLPAVTVAGKNEYDLSVSSADNDMFAANVSKTLVPGYDYKTNGKIFAYEFYLEKEGASGTETVPLPVGAKINGSFVSAVLPYAFLPVDFAHTATVSLDMSECVTPLAAGKYTLQVKAYSCTDILNPRNGYVLADGSTDINLTAPTVYAIKANAASRLFDRSASPLPVAFTIQTLGSNSVKATLQQKYAMSYVDMEGQVDQPVTVTGGTATLHLPVDTPKGTYRFVLSLYDGNGTAKARAIENIIIK